MHFRTGTPTGIRTTFAGARGDAGSWSRSSQTSIRLRTETRWPGRMICSQYPRLGAVAQRPHRAGRDAAVDQQGLAGDVAARLRREEHHRAVEIGRLTRTPDGDAFDQVLDPGFVLVHHVVLRGAK